MTEYRDVVSATMIYDSLPINDIFRKVDDDSVLGVMDLRFSPQPFFLCPQARRSGFASRRVTCCGGLALAPPALSERRHRHFARRLVVVPCALDVAVVMSVSSAASL
jgi:hypothetical protein